MKPSSNSAVLNRQDLFDLRWHRASRDLIGPITRLYADRMSPEVMLDRIRDLLAKHWAVRPASLRRLDLQRDLNPDWFLDQDMVGYVFYIDRFAGRLSNLPSHIDYLKDLGVTYAHMMPCLKPRPGDSDGGYAVMDYRAINPDLGTMADFQTVNLNLRAAGISPCIDMVLNHTAKEHEWAVKARAGDPFYRDFYRIFDDDRLPREYERTLVEIFPDQAPGSFTYYDDMDAWVWTTFNEYQWDLNWENPEVFLAVLDTILFLANKGVQVFRLDAVAFMWKRMGTVCQNLPEVHDLLQALTQATRVSSAAVIHKAEAIVGPKDLVPYLGAGSHAGRESQLAYHNNLMVQFWSSLAARDTRLMTHVLRSHFPESFRRASFATYIRCHDDIGWAITEEDTAYIPPMSGPGHRGFLADFYNGSFPGTFARGVDFQSNPETGDRRTNGSFASLAGLERALEDGDAVRIDLAIRRILLGHALIAAYGGMPLIYMGDEVGLMNDYGFSQVPAHADDSRWLQRPMMDWSRVETARDDPATPQGRILEGTRHILSVRKATHQLAGYVPTRVIDCGNPAVFAWLRLGDDHVVTCLANFTEHAQRVAVDLPDGAVDLLTGAPPRWAGAHVEVSPYGCLWLRS